MPVIFLSYRRSDSQDVTGRIYDRLAAKFTPQRVFKDVDNIPLGVSFPTHLKQQLAKANVTLVIIGPNWVNAADKQGKRRLDDPNDFVRVEVETALRNNMPVIPVLVSNAQMPSTNELPPSMQALAARNGMAVRPDPDFNNDIGRLFSGIDKLEKLLVQNAGSASKSKKAAEPIAAVPVATFAPPRHRAPAKKTPAGKRLLVYGLLAALLPVGVLGAVVGSALIPPAGGPKKPIGKETEQPKGDKLAEIKKDAPTGPKDAFRKPIFNTIGMKLVYIAPGKFQMGSPPSELERIKGSEFQHEVTLTKGFYMGVYAVTQNEYRTVMGENPSWFSAQGGGKYKVAGLETGRFPVETVNWTEAKEFCRKLSQTEGKTYSLPTEAEWEYACRAGTTTPFHFGETISTDQANYCGDYVYGNGAKGEYRKRTVKVGSFPASAWGLHDMHGNVFQWCEDWYDAKYYENSPKSNPLNENPGQYRVLRGGSWSYNPWFCRSAFRNLSEPDSRINYFGFRVVLRSP